MQTLNFIFNKTQLKIYGTVNEPIFVVNDVCDIINIKKDSDLIRRIKKDEFFRGGVQTHPQIPQYRGQQLAVINEFGLYEILFRSDSQIASQFRREISVWLKEQRIQQNILQQQKLLQFDELKKQFENEKQYLQQQLENERIQQRIDFLKNNYNHRVTLFYHPETEQLLYAISYDEKYRKQNTRKIINLLMNQGFEENEIEIVNYYDHYTKKESKQFVDQLDMYYKLQGDNVLVLA